MRTIVVGRYTALADLFRFNGVRWRVALAALGGLMILLQPHRWAPLAQRQIVLALTVLPAAYLLVSAWVWVGDLRSRRNTVREIYIATAATVALILMVVGVAVANNAVANHAFKCVLAFEAIGYAGLAAIFVSWVVDRGATRWRTRLVVPPGSTARRVLAVLYGRKTAERVFDQVIGDIQDDWLEYQCTNQVWPARVVVVRGAFQIATAVFVHTFGGILSAAASLWKASK
jgi:hypothetical protein